MTTGQLSFLEQPVAQVRRHDPAPAKRAAAMNRNGRATQADRILAYLASHDTITADYAWRNLGLPDEQITRGEWSTRIGVLIHRGHVERAGEVDELDRRNNTRRVLAYRLTPDGRHYLEERQG